MRLLFGIIRNILAIIGLITLIIAFILVIAFWQLTKAPALEGEMTPIEFTSASQQESYANSFDNKIDVLESELDDKDSGDVVSITFTQEEATAKILQEIYNSDIPVEISDIWVNFATNDDGEEVIQLLGKVDIGFATVTAGVEMEIEIDSNGDPKITYSDVAIGSGFGIPQQAKDLIADAIPSEEALTDMIKDLPIALTDIDISDGNLTFTGTKI